MKFKGIMLVCVSAGLLAWFTHPPHSTVNPKFELTGPLHEQIEAATDIEVLDHVEAHANGPVDAREMVSLFRRLPKTQGGILVRNKLFLVSEILCRTPDSIEHLTPDDLRLGFDYILTDEARGLYVRKWQAFLDSRLAPKDPERMHQLRQTLREMQQIESEPSSRNHRD